MKKVAEVSGFDMLFLGAYTKDLISEGPRQRTADGGAFYYGANVAVRMGLSVAAVTMLAIGDFAVVEKLRSLGVAVHARETAESTILRIRFPSANPDERVIHVDSTAGCFTIDDIGDFNAGVAVIGPSFRGEVGEEVLKALAARGCRIALDIQGFMRVCRNGDLVHENWPDADRVLPMVSILKADAKEAEILTGTRDLREAASRALAMGASEVIITDQGGALAADRQGMHTAPFLPHRLGGRSGRGDTCLAAYAARRISRPVSDAVVWAAAATSLKLEENGPFQATAGDIEDRAREIGAQCT